MNIFSTVQQLLNKAEEVFLLKKEDEIYARNQILSLLSIENYIPEQAGSGREIPDLLEDLTEYACEKGIIGDYLDAREIFASKIMDVMIPLPSAVNETFYRKYAQDPAEATDYFYELSKNSNYIQMNRISKNIVFQTESEYGNLDITINLSKPEKDPKQIAMERQAKQPETKYPKCLLCIENEGYAGRIGHPARSSHRMIRVNVPRETWYLQYSPYVYYNEHCILLCEEHRDMKISKATFERLLSFVEQFPHYFIGSNADLPIVGGSILTHDHYQGGRYEFAMAKAQEEFPCRWDRFPELELSIVKWPMSVLRLKSRDASTLADAADMVLAFWKDYSDPELGILAMSDGSLHNTITPIARKRNGLFELDLVLRNNRSNDEHPLGIFHPHADVHHIKKENIGLIEVMGLAVLPARLEQELREIESYLAGNTDAAVASYHLDWAKELEMRYGNDLNENNVSDIVKKETGLKFLRVLQDAGVFKRDSEGKDGFLRFIDSLKMI
ncbi:UDP-glucose--hexose-1-phosphate uridylyltransferase [Bacillus sp. MUM 13]|uniref:UDP-glucose--hexose-1-phosphate uridylyltransferase n=1 Tax=Bacillus sp. MUM 13 TaxID=1678001 RepID=UPI0008F5CCBC|nr:UDP-glucose--hexose-1-phosphate uridylyltransferase [Bacillus sp. MUM 13]OIK12899.1 galactose-1-phosphate uridylyltransferase [Bacillus sp. MUM 13]